MRSSGRSRKYWINARKNYGDSMRQYELGQVVRLKKEHPCGDNRWKIIRVGMDFRIKCLNCGRSVLLPRAKFEKRVREIIEEAEQEEQ